MAIVDADHEREAAPDGDRPSDEFGIQHGKSLNGDDQWSGPLVVVAGFATTVFSIGSPTLSPAVHLVITMAAVAQLRAHEEQCEQQEESILRKATHHVSLVDCPPGLQPSPARNCIAAPPLECVRFEQVHAESRGPQALAPEKAIARRVPRSIPSRCTKSAP